MSLFDEIRLSFFNKSKLSISELNCTEFFEKRCENFDTSYITVATQTDDSDYYVLQCKVVTDSNCFQQTSLVTSNKGIDIETQTDNRHLLNNTENNSPLSTEKCTSGINDSTQLNLSQLEPYLQSNTVENYNLGNNKNTDLFEVFNAMEETSINTQVNVSETDTNGIYYNGENCIESLKCMDCDKLKDYSNHLEDYVKKLLEVIAGLNNNLECYDDALRMFKKSFELNNTRTEFYKAVFLELRTKLDSLEAACVEQGNKINEMKINKDVQSAGIQTEIDQSSISTQVAIPCTDCTKRNTSNKSLRRYLWEPLKCLFQLFAVLCFVCALSLLYSVARRHHCREPLPWRWLQAQDLLDLLLRIDYAPDVPM